MVKIVMTDVARWYGIDGAEGFTYVQGRQAPRCVEATLFNTRERVT